MAATKPASFRLLAILLAIALAPLLHSVSIEGICDSGVWVNSYMKVIGIGWAGLIAFIAFVYMLGHAFNIVQFIHWSKTEIGQVLLGIAFLIVILWLMNIQCNLKIGEFANWAGIKNNLISESDTMATVAVKELEWAISQTHFTIALVRYELGLLNIRATFSQSAAATRGIGGNGITFSPLSGDWTIMGPLQMMLNLNTTFLLSLLFQYFSLAIFSSKSGLFLFFVPLGLIIRSIPYLRGFGGALASIGVGFYILYPMFLAIIGLTLPPIVLYENNALFGAYQKNGLNYIVQKEHSITGTAFSYYNSMPDFEDWGNGMLKAAAVESPSDPECEGASKCFYTANLAPLFELTALNFIRAILLPSAGLIVIVSFVRDLSAIFGEEVEASRLVQMV